MEQQQSHIETAKISSENAVSPTVQATQEAIHQLFAASKRDGANFLRSTIPALTVKLQKMMDQSGPVDLQTLKGNKPALSDREFR